MKKLFFYLKCPRFLNIFSKSAEMYWNIIPISADTTPPLSLDSTLKVHKIEIFFGFDFEICIISLLVMSKY